MTPRTYPRDLLRQAVAEAANWADVLRRLGLKDNGGQRRVLREKVEAFGLDTTHFTPGSRRPTYSDEAIAEAAAQSTTLHEVVKLLGAKPAQGTLSHIARRIEAAGIDTSHFPSKRFFRLEPTIDTASLAEVAAKSDSVRAVTEALALPDDERARASVRRLLKARGIDTSHFRHQRNAISTEELRAAVPTARSFADVMRALGMEVTYVNHQRVRHAISRLPLDTSHFVRRTWGTVRALKPKPATLDVLTVRPPGATRVRRERLHSALQKLGVPYKCMFCGNEGEWLDCPVTLQIDHINGDWLDNRVENLRYLCPNCHAITATWCEKGRAKPLSTGPESRVN